MTVNYHKTTSRRPWMMRQIPEIIRKAGKPMTLAQIAAGLNETSNPSDFSAKRWRKNDWEYHFGVSQYPEVRLILKRLVAKFMIEEDRERRKHDPIAGRVRYSLAGPLTRLAGIASGPQTPSGPAALLRVV